MFVLVFPGCVRGFLSGRAGGGGVGVGTDLVGEVVEGVQHPTLVFETVVSGLVRVVARTHLIGKPVEGVEDAVFVYCSRCVRVWC